MSTNCASTSTRSRAPPSCNVINAALELRNVMGELGLECYPKTSGGRGIHVFTKIEPASFVDAVHAAIAIGRELASRRPDKVTIEWWKERRGERVFVDYNQMARDRLMASPYSISSGARSPGMSAPLTSDEVPDVHPDDFTVVVPGRRSAGCGARRRLGPAVRASKPSSIDCAVQLYELGTTKGQGEMPYPPEYPKMLGELPRVQPSRQTKLDEE